jgi:O-acetyl-ADP-ribose deacetylase (regulator of RNase III)
MRWIVKQGNIIDEPADVLICSANVDLNLSGGVGGEILVRYGNAMQKELHRFLSERYLRCARQGDVIQTSSCGTPYKAVLHAVAVNVFYQSSPEVIESIVSKSLRLAASLGARKVALTALATGYGRLSIQDFAKGISPLMAEAFPPIEEVIICVRKDYDVKQLAAALPEVAAA